MSYVKYGPCCSVVSELMPGSTTRRCGFTMPCSRSFLIKLIGFRNYLQSNSNRRPFQWRAGDMATSITKQWRIPRMKSHPDHVEKLFRLKLLQPGQHFLRPVTEVLFRTYDKFLFWWRISKCFMRFMRYFIFDLVWFQIIVTVKNDTLHEK